VLVGKLPALLEVDWVGWVGVGVQSGGGACGQRAAVALLQGARPADAGDEFIPCRLQPLVAAADECALGVGEFLEAATASVHRGGQAQFCLRPGKPGRGVALMVDRIQ
jgi:hypothetical protein